MENGLGNIFIDLVVFIGFNFCLFKIGMDKEELEGVWIIVFILLYCSVVVYVLDV